MVVFIKLSGVIISVTGAIIVISKGNLYEMLSGGIGWGELFFTSRLRETHFVVAQGSSFARDPG